MGDSCEQVLTKNVENCLDLKRRLYHFQLKRGISIIDHINVYTKLLVDLTNVNVAIEDKDKALILLRSPPDKGYETFVLTLINGRTSLSYSETTTALINLELRWKDMESSSNYTSAEVLTARGSSPN